MRFKIAGLVLSVVALGGAAPGWASGTLGALAGTGTSEFSECAQDSLQLSIQGSEVATGDWTFTVHAVSMDPTCQFPAIAVAAQGEWTPAGGCVPLIVVTVLLGDSSLCLTNPQPNGPLTDYEFAVCENVPCSQPGIPDRVSVLVLDF